MNANHRHPSVYGFTHPHILQPYDHFLNFPSLVYRLTCFFSRLLSSLFLSSLFKKRSSFMLVLLWFGILFCSFICLLFLLGVSTVYMCYFLFMIWNELSFLFPSLASLRVFIFHAISFCLASELEPVPLTLRRDKYRKDDRLFSNENKFTISKF